MGMSTKERIKQGGRMKSPYMCGGAILDVLRESS